MIHLEEGIQGITVLYRGIVGLFSGRNETRCKRGRRLKNVMCQHHKTEVVAILDCLNLFPSQGSLGRYNYGLYQGPSSESWEEYKIETLTPKKSSKNLTRGRSQLTRGRSQPQF